MTRNSLQPVLRQSRPTFPVGAVDQSVEPSRGVLVPIVRRDRRVCESPQAAEELTEPRVWIAG